jgi:predicted aldo/keto reductase-like oxidoreductase
MARFLRILTRSLNPFAREPMKRRVFLKTVGTAAGVAALGAGCAFKRGGAERGTASLPRRKLGRTGQELSVVGFPGLALIHYEQPRCNAAVCDAFDRGVNYFDVAPAYGNGECETKLGISLQAFKREQYFLACKTKKRDKEGARKELEESLRLLKTDHLDLYQLHHLVKPSEVKQALEPGGAIEAIQEAKKEGKLKWIGFSAHTTKAALEAMENFKFDTVMFPINFVEYYTRDYGREVLELGQKQGTSVLAIKPLSWGTWPKEGKRTREWWYRSVEEPGDIELAMRFALSQPPVIAGIPPSFLDLLDRTIEAASKFTPLDTVGMEKLKLMASHRESIFLAEERQVALNLPVWQLVYPDSPHECGGHHQLG